MPISDDDFLFEMTLCALLAPGSEGVPTFKSDMVGERQFLKLPGQFRAFSERKPLDEATGRALANGRAEVHRLGRRATRRAQPPRDQPRSMMPKPGRLTIFRPRRPTSISGKTMISAATSADQVRATWNDQTALRKSIAWTDEHTFNGLQAKVKRAIDFLSRAPA
jgi:hypothetical protein